MTTLADFAIAKRWPPRNPGAIQLYSFPTPNGVKVSIALEEMGLPYDAHKISIMDGDQKTPEFLAISPNNKIPAIIDPDGPGGAPLTLFESGAILIYLAEKSGKLLPKDPAARAHVIQWLMFQMGGVGPMFGQLGFFYAMGGKDMTDPTARDRYIGEASRLLGVLDGQLAGRDWVAGEYSIADIALAPWVRTLRDFYKAGEVVGLASHANIARWMAAFEGRDAVQRGLVQPPRD
ncbi:glutathione S-transferase N-terminal domain-containing protein [Roseicitreum antarcticum]|uniref:Glutathione S-transferase n=1 Tax=Roseicitreum antarcticum TaxID=564137 RepID=A0A1H2XH91_9RHOB|nr:glutathione S-transferase N-terminal domain-containing protein [Roseicitreum antarcticum]SDW91864.1 glutathione S-transferase [Roseicitreum antarcticum]